MISLNPNEIRRLNGVLSPLNCKDFFSLLGGKALGLQILKRISGKIPLLFTPPSICLKFDNNPQIFHQNFLTLLKNKDFLNERVVCKISTTTDDFSEKAERGLNSSVNNPKIILTSDCFSSIGNLVDSFSFQHQSDIKAILFQKFFEIKSNTGFICHVNANNGLIEISYENNKYIISFDSDGTVFHSESTDRDRSIFKISAIVDIPQICLTLRKIHQEIGFDCNLEGFIDGKTLIALQLRKTPSDIVFNEALHKRIQNFDTTKYSNITFTKLVFGDFDIEGKPVSIKDLKSENSNEDLIILNDTLVSKVWENPIIKKRLQDNNKRTLVVSFMNGFHLSHSEDDLPPIGTIRKTFKHICLSWLNVNVILNKTLRFISDGESALFCFADPVNIDRKRTIQVKGKSVNFVQLTPDFIPPFDKITSVAVVPFTTDGKIVAALLNRGIDLPGGHVLKTEFTIDEVARREAREETCITLKQIYVAKIIQSDYYGDTPEKLTYMIVTTAFVNEFLEFIPTEECTAREVVSTNIFIERYSAGNKLDMEDLIISAKGILGIRN